jgi:hypothetical protein
LAGAKAGAGVGGRGRGRGWGDRAVVHLASGIGRGISKR